MPTFLNLPGEIRNMIYKRALVDEGALERRHSAFCAYHPTQSSDVPIPPYALTIQHSSNPLPVCPCTKRQTLGLLASCRQIHQEASSIFWANNSFTFKSHRDFVTCISDSSERTCQQITSVTVINNLRQPDVKTNNLNEEKTAHLWAGIFRLTDLRRLQIDPGYLDFHGTLANRIPEQLPKLKSFWATTLHARAYRSPRGSVPGLYLLSDDSGSRLPAIYFLSSMPLRWRMDQFRVGSKELKGLFIGEFLALEDSVAAMYITAEWLSGRITDELELTPATAPVVTPDEPEDYVVHYSEFPYDEVAELIHYPNFTFKVGDRDFYVQTLGLPPTPDELASYDRQLHTNKCLKWGRYREMVDAETHEQVWGPVRRRRSCDLETMLHNLVARLYASYLYWD